MRGKQREAKSLRYVYTLRFNKREKDWKLERNRGDISITQITL